MPDISFNDYTAQIPFAAGAGVSGTRGMRAWPLRLRGHRIGYRSYWLRGVDFWHHRPGLHRPSNCNGQRSSTKPTAAEFLPQSSRGCQKLSQCNSKGR